MLCPYRHVIYCFEARPENGSQSGVSTSIYLRPDRMDGLWLTYARGKLAREDKQIWLGSSKLLKILIGDENKDTFMKYATMEVSIFL